MEMVIAHVEHASPQLADYVDGPLPNGLAALVESCLAKDPDDRATDAAQLGQMLADIAADCPWHERAAAAAWETS